jgi:hypothetical protein
MKDDYHGDRDSAQTIELRNPLCEIRLHDFSSDSMIACPKILASSLSNSPGLTLLTGR